MKHKLHIVLSNTVKRESFNFSKEQKGRVLFDLESTKPTYSYTYQEWSCPHWRSSSNWILQLKVWVFNTSNLYNSFVFQLVCICFSLSWKLVRSWDLVNSDANSMWFLDISITCYIRKLVLQSLHDLIDDRPDFNSQGWI